MDFKQLEYFRAVVDAGSVSQAAKNLGMTQPPISMSVAKLEAELGVRLLDRTAKGVQPTNAGLHLLAEGRRLLSGRQRLAETLTLMGQGVVGELRVGAEPMVINEFIAEVLSEFLDQAPGARVSLTDVPPDSILRKVLQGDLDLGCVPFAPEQYADFVKQSCEYVELVEFDLRLAVPLHRLREHHPDGRGWGRWILPYPLASFTGFPECVRRALADDETFEVMEVSTPQTAISFVGAGLGVSPTTQWMAQHHAGVAMVPAPEWMCPMRASLLWRKDAELTPLMKRWIAVSRDVASQVNN